MASVSARSAEILSNAFSRASSLGSSDNEALEGTGEPIRRPLLVRKTRVRFRTLVKQVVRQFRPCQKRS